MSTNIVYNLMDHPVYVVQIFPPKPLRDSGNEFSSPIIATSSEFQKVFVWRREDGDSEKVVEECGFAQLHHRPLIHGPLGPDPELHDEEQPQHHHRGHGEAAHFQQQQQRRRRRR